MDKDRIKKIEKVSIKHNDKDYLEVTFKSTHGGTNKHAFGDPEKYLEKCNCCGKPKFHHELDKADVPAKQTQKSKDDMTSDILNMF